jgi:hypothetical protein
MTNKELAQRARQLADRAERGSLARASALIAVVALLESKTITGARKVLTGWTDGPEDIRSAGLALLDQLTTEGTAP